MSVYHVPLGQIAAIRITGTLATFILCREILAKAYIILNGIQEITRAFIAKGKRILGPGNKSLQFVV